MVAVMEKPHASDIIDKKTVIAMIGLPVYPTLFPSHCLGNGKELHFKDAPTILELEGSQDRGF